jgi:hypothetical protein
MRIEGYNQFSRNNQPSIRSSATIRGLAESLEMPILSTS